MSKKIKISKKKYKKLRKKANSFEQLSHFLDNAVNIQGILWNIFKEAEEEPAENVDCKDCDFDDYGCGCCDESCSECSNYEYQTEDIDDYELPVAHSFIGYSKDENTIGVDFGNDYFYDFPVEHASRLLVENIIAKAYFNYLKEIGVLHKSIDPTNEADDILNALQESGNFNNDGTLKIKKNKSNLDSVKEERNDK